MGSDSDFLSISLCTKELTASESDFGSDSIRILSTAAIGLWLLALSSKATAKIFSGEFTRKYANQKHFSSRRSRVGEEIASAEHTWAACRQARAPAVPVNIQLSKNEHCQLFTPEGAAKESGDRRDRVIW